MLRLKAESVTPLVDVPALARDGTIQEVARVELYRRLRRRNFEHTARGRLVHAGRRRHPCTLAIEHEVVVISVPEDELLIVVFDPGPDPGRLREIKGSALDRSQFASGNQVLVDGSEAVGVDHDFMIENVAVPLTLQVEVTMLADIERSSFVGGGFIIDDQFV